MSECPDCTKARAGVWPLFRSNCHGCAARHVARSIEAWNAMHPAGTGDVQPLSNMVDSMLSGVPRDDAVAMVREWVRIGKEQR